MDSFLTIASRSRTPDRDVLGSVGEPGDPGGGVVGFAQVEDGVGRAVGLGSFSQCASFGAVACAVSTKMPSRTREYIFM